MTITLGDPSGTGAEAPVVLVAGQARNQAGDPVGPDGLVFRDERGVERRELVGADGVLPEWVRPDARSVSFSATRIFPTPAAALEYMAEAGPAEGRCAARPLFFGATQVMADACIVRREASMEGCAVVVRYEIEGF